MEKAIRYRPAFAFETTNLTENDIRKYLWQCDDSYVKNIASIIYRDIYKHDYRRWRDLEKEDIIDWIFDVCVWDVSKQWLTRP